MNARWLPRTLDNSYQGHASALFIFALVLLVRIIQSGMAIVAGASTLSGADGVPLETFSPSASQSVLSLFALTGCYRLVLAVIGLLVLLRYRRAVPFMLILLAGEFLAKQVLYRFLPLSATSAPAFYVNLGLFFLMLLGIFLALPKRPAGPPSPNAVE